MLDIEAIRGILPHRYPFLMIDRVVDRGEDRVVALKNVTANEPYFQGHFPAPLEAVMPGALILEAMAQTAAFLVLEGPVQQPRAREGYLVGVERARFRRKVVPGDQLRIEAVRLRVKRDLIQADVRASVSGETAATATLTLIVRDRATEGRP